MNMKAGGRNLEIEIESWDFNKPRNSGFWETHIFHVDVGEGYGEEGYEFEKKKIAMFALEIW